MSTLAALGLDVYVYRLQNRRGLYKLHDLDTKPRPEATAGPFTDRDDRYASGGLEEPRESEAWEEPRPSVGPYNEQSTVDTKKLGQQGYAIPDGQFEYDTGYHGGHAEKALA